jgi:hypothetical protein
MSSFTYDGPRNVLCTPAPMSPDVRIQPTPEPTPIWGRLLPKQVHSPTTYDKLPAYHRRIERRSRSRTTT